MNASQRERPNTKKDERSAKAAEQSTSGPHETDPGTPGRYWVRGVGWMEGAQRG